MYRTPKQFVTDRAGVADLDFLLRRLKPDFPAARVAGLPRRQLVEEIMAAMPGAAGPQWQRFELVERRELVARLIAELLAEDPPRLGRAFRGRDEQAARAQRLPNRHDESFRLDLAWPLTKAV